MADALKGNAAAAVAELNHMGVQVAMITGDNRATAESIARQVGIDRVLAEVLPEDEVAEVRRLQETGRVVAMVDDGIDDAGVLVQADPGIPIGTDVAIESSDTTLISGASRGSPPRSGCSRRTFRTIAQNLFWACGYKAAGAPTGSVPPAVRTAGCTAAANRRSFTGTSRRPDTVAPVQRSCR